MAKQNTLAAFVTIAEKNDWGWFYKIRRTARAYLHLNDEDKKQAIAAFLPSAPPDAIGRWEQAVLFETEEAKKNGAALERLFYTWMDELQEQAARLHIRGCLPAGQAWENVDYWLRDFELNRTPLEALEAATFDDAGRLVDGTSHPSHKMIFRVPRSLDGLPDYSRFRCACCGAGSLTAKAGRVCTKGGKDG